MAVGMTARIQSIHSGI